MRLFNRFKKIIASAILVCFIPAQAWAQGIIIPAGSSLNVNSGQLTVPGDINNQGGGLTITTGAITLNGNWSNTGTFHSGTSTVYFNAAKGASQSINGGGVANAFYNLVHTTDSTVSLTGTPVGINNDFTNTPPTTGSFNAAGLNMTVDGIWDNAANSTFISGGNAVNNQTVALAGGSQKVLGTTTFYNFDKTVTSAATLTFDSTSGAQQTFINNLTMGSNNPSTILTINSTTTGTPSPTQAYIALIAPGTQNINNVDVYYSNAANGRTLVASGNSLAVDIPQGGTNTNWFYGNVTFTWLGGVSTDWNNPANWDLGAVPAVGDTVIIPATVLPNQQPNLCPSGVITGPGACTPIAAIANLNIESNASLTLNGQSLTVSKTFINSGKFILDGTETVSLTQDPTVADGGTFVYVGDGTGHTIPIKYFTGPVDYNNVVIDDTHANKDTFVAASGQNITTSGNGTATTGNLTVTSGTLDISANSDTLTVAGTLLINGAAGTLTATKGSIVAQGALTITAGTLTAPSGTLSVAGNFTDYGTFNNSSGTVVLSGGDQTVLGTTTFYNFTKIVTSPATLTFDSAANTQQTFTDSLIMEGNSVKGSGVVSLLTINSTSSNQAYIALIAPGVQAIKYVDVFNSNASNGRTLVAGVGSIDGPPAGQNVNWDFGDVNFTWIGGGTVPAGADPTDWNNPYNWNLGEVPGPLDTVYIPGVTTAPYQPDLCPAGVITPCSDVAVANLDIESGATLTLDGSGLTVGSISGSGNFVGGTFTNAGNVILDGTENVNLTQDGNEGTFTYVGDGTSTPIPIITFGAPDYYNLVLDSPTNPFELNSDITTNGDLDLSSGTLTVLTNTTSPSTPYVLTVGGDLNLGAAGTGGGAATNGTLNAANSNLAVSGSVDIATAGSVLTAPGPGDAFTVTGNFTDNGTFNNSKGAVTFNTTGTSIISGDTNFYDFISTTPGQTLDFAPNSNQTISDVLTLFGAPGNLITLGSTQPGQAWNFVLPVGTSGAQVVAELNVQDSDALNNTITCLNCKDSGDNNANWIFDSLSITSPSNGTTVGQTPTVIGISIPNSNVALKDSSGNWVATTKADANGNFRVVVGQDQDNLPSITVASGAQLALAGNNGNSLTPYLISTNIPPISGLTNNLTVVSSPSTTQVPIITSPINGTFAGNNPVVSGQGAPGATVTVQALDANGNLILVAGSGTVAADGSYSMNLSKPLPELTNYLSVTQGNAGAETTSPLILIFYANPFGFVYNSANNQLIQGASVTLYNAATNQPASGPGIQSCNISGVCTSANPFTTLADGFYGFFLQSGNYGNYYLVVSAGGYTFPSKQPVVPAGRVIHTGSEGQVFPVTGTVTQIDLPLDANTSLLRIVKTADKSEAHIGDIVTYTINIQNLSAAPVNNVFINDRIPPGFKYLKNRVILNSTPIANPSGQRPLVFNVGTVPTSPAAVLEYQLVIGSGVTMGSYKNMADAQFSNGWVASNPTSTTVKVILDPVFDLGTVIGKVFFDWNENGIQDAPRYDDISHETIIEKPVPNVQLVMEDGTVITTDREGQFSIPGLLPGRHLFRLDERSLPPGSYLTTEKGVIVDITAGSIAKVNFGVNIDQSQISGRDAVFFNEKIRLTQDRNRPVPRLNAALFDASANAKPKTEEVLLHEGALVRQAEFRIFTNYSPFIGSWHLDILDADTKKLIKRFEGTALNINDPIYWNGKDTQDIIISADHKYSYVLSVMDTKNNDDDTKENPITVREIKDAQGLKKEIDETKDVLKDRAERYRKWLDAQSLVNNINHQLIEVRGETIHVDRQGTDVRSLRVMKGNQVFTDIPLMEQYGLTPDELMASGFSSKDEKDNLEIILPNGDYSLDVVSAKANEDASTQKPVSAPLPSAPASAGGPSPVAATVNQFPLEHYGRQLKVGDDYIMFVGLGDAKVGYNIDRGNIEPIQSSDQKPGFYAQGKAAYYLKGQILGKYLITSSFDTDRQQKALFRSLDPNVYYPVYGDQSSINYDAADTQGPLYLKVEWDKSTAILGNYAVDFNDTEFAAFSQKYYGGMINYQSVASNPYGDARTKVVVYNAHIQQLPSHNEFLATGGSLYFLKYRNVIQGSDTVTIQVRDQTTGLVVGSQTLTNGADYELDNGQGRILFWQPVAMIAQSQSIISNSLINGNPIYVVIDYQYAVSDMQLQGAQGARIAQAVGDNVVLGGTYVQDNSNGQQYTLAGTDATLHVNKDSTVKAEYAQTSSQEQGSYVSTDGGITFTPLILNNSASGKAYGIKGDTRLFDNIGLKSYYKWVGNDFGATDTTYQQGKETMGLSMTFDMTPVTRLTASEDIQRLLAGGNLQTSTQVGASETDTTMLQIVHTAERLTLTGQFQLVQTRSVINGVESTTNQKGATMAGQAQYDLTDRIKLTMGQQVDVMNKNNTATTLGIADRITDHFKLNAQEVISSQGHALTAGVTNQLTPKIALTTDYTLTSLNTGETDKTASVMVEDQISKNITTTGTVAQTASSTGANTMTASLGTKAKISDGMTLDMNVGKTQNALGGAQGGTSINLNGTTQVGNTTVTGTATGQVSGGVGTPVSDALSIGTTGITTTSSFGVQATTKVDENNSTNGSLTIGNESTGAQSKTIGFGNTSKIDQELQAVTSNSFSFSPDNGTTDSSKYGLVRSNAAGQKTEMDYTRQLANIPTSISQSNIYGLSGDVNDKLALNGSVESGKVQNLDGTQTNRTDFSVGVGYVLKDTETAVERLKNSLKLELRLDKGVGTDSLHQYVVYDALQGKITDNLTGNIKLDYSKTLDVTTGAVAERHQEIILGMAYRPVNFDNLNLIAEYSYQDGYGGGLQQADALNSATQQSVTQVFTAQAIYDMTDNWQLAEKIAYRIESEQDTGFQFTQTHTWLVIHRLNYKIDSDWTIGGELRDLTQVEAKDNKQGMLLEAIRKINDNTELAVGWNFTKYNDDLTNLSYTSQGPYIRMTGAFYDRSPAEKARMRAKWLDTRIGQWAWIMVRKELAKKDSKIMLELNRAFALAHAAQTSGRLEESRQIYKDIITAGQMMFNEACEYIRGRIAFEEKLQQYDKTAREYFKGGEYVKARKIWEKVVADASKGMVK